MKTLYININGEDIQSKKDVYVVGRPEDAIVNKFYYELGKEILKDVDGSVGKGINKKSIVTDFMDRNKESYDAIWKEWEAVKDKLLGENPTGLHKVKLPTEYISWLNNNGQVSYSEIAKSLHSKDGVVEISIDKIYRNAIGIIVNSIEPSECTDCKQFVVNDSCVTDDSAISLAIMERVKGVVFVPYEDPNKCPRPEKSLCECPEDSDVKYDVYFQSVDLNVLKSVDFSKVLKMLYELLSLSLDEIGNIFQNKPTALKREVPKEEAHIIKKKFESIGFKIQLQMISNPPKKSLFPVLICEKCSSEDLTTLSSYEEFRDVGYHCNNCGWEVYNEKRVKDDELHKFFPVFGIVMGESNIDDAAYCGIDNEPYIYGRLGIQTHEDWDLWDTDDSAGTWINGINFRKPRGNDAITVMEITNHEPMITNWKEMGFDWSLSYTEWYNLFDEMGYSIRVEIEPQKEYDEEDEYWYLRARFRAYAPDDSIQFYLHFCLGKKGCQQHSKNTLYCIEVLSRNSPDWE